MHELIILTSPPATGKTYWIKTFAGECSPKKILLISPLRALANECKVKLPKNVIVVTPEEWWNKKILCDVVIIDELHLWMYWGDTFRQRMWDAFYEFAEAELVIGLTATMNEKMREDFSLMGCQFDRMTWMDFGNQNLKYKPYCYRVAPSKNWLLERAMMVEKGTETSLFFCAYRSEVETVTKLLRGQGYSVWSCVGGEANELSLKVQNESAPDFIVCTSVLSHGVNLPSLKCVYLLYELNNIDFWIQMVARGGRQGEKFEVFALERPAGIKWNWLINFLAIRYLNLKMGTTFIQRQIQSWFLKESSSPESLTKNAT